MSKTVDRGAGAAPGAAEPSAQVLTGRSEVRVWTAVVSFAAIAALAFSIFAFARADSPVNVKASSTAPSADSGAATAGQKIDFSAEPPAGFKAKDPTAPAPSAETVHKVTLHAVEGQVEIAPGIRQEMWSFSTDGKDSIPGPVMRGKVGDTFEFTLVNDGKMGHSIDFHASMVNPADEMRTINPGEKLVYRFKANHSGIFMYHCGTAPVVHHVANGMYGALIVDPPGGLPKVDKELVFLQSDLYTAPAGQLPALEKIMTGKWDAVVFNGYVNQYAAQPIRVEPNERIRVWVMDLGPQADTSFHVIGTIFDTVYKEGAYRLRPGPEAGGSQALDLEPAQGGFVEFTLPVPGTYTFLTHKLVDASKGALGVFQAGEPAQADEPMEH